MKGWKRVGVDEVNVGDKVYFVRYDGAYVPAIVIKKGRKRIYLEYTIGLVMKDVAMRSTSLYSVLIPYEWNIDLEKEMKFLYNNVAEAKDREEVRKMLGENGYHLIRKMGRFDEFRKENLKATIYYGVGKPFLYIVEDTETEVQYYHAGWNIDRAIELAKEKEASAETRGNEL